MIAIYKGVEKFEKVNVHNMHARLVRIKQINKSTFS